MKALVVGSDHNALVCALELKKKGHEVEVLEGPKFGGIASVVPGCPLAPEVATDFDLGVSLEIVGRVGLTSDGKRADLKLREISGDVSERDKVRWRDFVKVMNNASELWRGLFAEEDVVGRWREFGRRQSMEVLRLPWQSLSVLLDDWFESDVLKAALGVAALRGARQGPFGPGSAFLLLQRWARGEVFGRARTGGMMLKKLAEDAGVTFSKDQVAQFQVSLGKVSKALTDTGREIEADIYVTSEDPVRTLNERIGIGLIDPDHAEVCETWDCRSTTAVAKLAPDDKYDGAIVSLADSLEMLERAYDPTKYGQYSEVPFAELDSRSGWLYVAHLDGEEAEAKTKELCEKYNLGEIKRFSTPSGLAEKFGATGGHLFGGERSLWQSYQLRERLSNPLTNLVLCGASTGPADYSGVSGRIAANRVEEVLAVTV